MKTNYYILMLFLLVSTLLGAQTSPTTVTWALAGNTNPSSTSGTGYTAYVQYINDQSSAGTSYLRVVDYAGKNSSGTATLQRVSGPSSSTLPNGYNANYYVEYDIKAESNNISVSNIAMKLATNGGGNVRVAICYSTDNFGNTYYLGGYNTTNNNVLTRDNAAPYVTSLSFGNSAFNGSNNIIVQAGSKIMLRVYPWYTSASTGKTLVSGDVSMTFTRIYNVGGSGNIVSGNSTSITLSGSETGINYQLYKDGTAVGSTTAGTGSSLSWSVSDAGTYTVKSTNDGSGTTMNGSAVVTVSQASATPLSSPTNLSASSPNYTGSFHASWDAVTNAISYSGNVYQGASVVKTFTAGSTSTDISGLTQGGTYTFTVTAVGDGTTYSNSAESSKSGSVTIPVQPTVSSLSPSNGTIIPVSGTISVVFSENVTRNSSNDITLGGATVSESNITISGATVTISYSGLSYNNNSCGLSIPSSAFKSSSSNAPTAVATTATYITPDNIVPTLSKMSISGGATLPVNGFISLVMSEACKAGSATVSIGSKTISPSISSSNSNLVYINYSGLAYDTDYTLTIPTNAITDIAGNSYAATTVTFHTEVDAKGTQFFSFTPDATSVPGSSSGTVTQTVNGYSMSFAAVLSAGTRNASPYTYAFKTNSVTLPTLPSVGELSFYIQCGGGSVPQEYYIQKLAVDGVTWNTIETFIIGTNDRTLVKTAAAQSSIPTTLRLVYNSSNLWFYFIDVYQYNLNGPVDDGLNPSVASTTPTASATNAPINGSIKLTCSENVVLGSGSMTLNGVTLTPAIVGKTITLPYTNLQYSTSYTLSVPAGAFKDLFNNSCAAFTLSFNTMDHPAVTKKAFDFVVGVDGNFSAAIAAATAASGNRFRIFFPNGQYNIGINTGDGNQMTTIALPNISYIGQSSSGVTLYNLPSTEGIGTTATIHLTSGANNIYMQDLTLSNNYPYDGSTGRAVALWDQGTKNIYKNITLLSHQDTYYSGSNGRTYFEGGSIHGTVDFICGGNDVFFSETQLYLENRSGNVIAAPATSTNYGYVFSGCTIDGASGADGNFYLGRPWQNSPRAVYINTKMNILPAAIGWTTMGATPPTLFGEYNSTNSSGNPVNLSSRMTTYTYNAVSTTINPFLTFDQASAYTIDNVLGSGDAWQPQQSTGQATVPVISGNGNAISWADNSYVSCWGIFKDGVFVTFVTTNSYSIPGSVTSGTYTVRAANEMGGLSAISNSYAYTATTQTTDYFRSKASGNSGDLTSWESSADNTNWISATSVPTVAATTITILNGHTISVNSDLNLSNLTLNSGSTLTVNSGIRLSVASSMTNNGTLNLLSDASGTATILTPTTIDGSGTSNVQQYLTAGRNWYVSSPVTGATSASLDATNSTVYYYNEAQASWPQITNNTTGLDLMKGYVVNPASTGALTFSGSLNTGTKSITIYRTAGQTKEGFNLVGNPYASYLDWSQVNRGNAMSTLWYRTKNAGSTYVFDTYNALGGMATNLGVKAITNMVPPMQSFWVRVANGQSQATISVSNAQRGHIDQGTNGFKVKSETSNTQSVLCLEISNGTNTDQALVYTNPNAINSFDDYDSPKMFNNSLAIAEIYTLVGNESLAINGMNTITYDAEIPLGFSTSTAGTFCLKASQISNFVSGTQVILKDYADVNSPVITDLSDGSTYSFSSGVLTNNTSRFALIFHAPSVATGLNPAAVGQLWISSIGNKLMINETVSNGTSVEIFNAVGQRIVSKTLNSASTLSGIRLPAGAYIISINQKGQKSTQKFILN